MALLTSAQSSHAKTYPVVNLQAFMFQACAEQCRLRAGRMPDALSVLQAHLSISRLDIPPWHPGHVVSDQTLQPEPSPRLEAFGTQRCRTRLLGEHLLVLTDPFESM